MGLAIGIGISPTLREGVRVSGARTLLADYASGWATDFRDLSAAVVGHSSNFSGNVNSFLTYTSPSTKYVANASGILVPGTTIRTEFDGATALGLLSEEAATELLQFSEDAGNAYWTKSGVTVSDNAGAAPDGALTADKFVEGSGSVSPSVFRNNGGVVNGVPYWYSDFAKAAERTRFNLVCNNGFPVNVTADLVAGTIAASVGTAAIRQCGGWYRCGAFATTVSVTSGNLQRRVYPASGGHPYTGDGASGLLAWGANFVQSSALTSYIARTGSGAATRSADNITLSASAVPAFNTVAIDARTAIGAATQVLWQADDGTDANRVYIVRDASRNVRCIIVDGGVEQCNLDLGVVADGADLSVAFAWAAGDFAASLNGGTAVADAAGTVPTVNTIRFGRSVAGEHWNASIKTVTGVPA